MNNYYDFRSPDGDLPGHAKPLRGKAQKPMTMRTAYNRTGFSALLCYGVVMIVTGILIAGVIVAIMMPELLTMITSDGHFRFGSLPDLIAEWTSGTVAEWITLVSVLAAGAGFAIALPLMRKVLRYGERQPIPKRAIPFPLFLLVILAAYGLWGLGAYCGNFVDLLGFPNSMSDTMNPDTDHLVLSMIPLIYGVVGAPVLEELVFRKTLLDVLHPYGQKCAALVTALLFGLTHGNSGQFLLAFLLGLLFAAVYMKTGRIGYTMILHFIINFTASLPQILSVAGLDVADIFDTYVLAGLTVVGLLVLFFIRKNDLFRLTASTDADPNRSMFRNAGMMIAVIGGTVQLGLTDLSLMLMSVIDYRSFVPLLALLSTSLTVLTVILVCTLGGRRRKRNGEEPSPYGGDGPEGPVSG